MGLSRALDRFWMVPACHGNCELTFFWCVCAMCVCVRGITFSVFTMFSMTFFL